MAKSHGQRVISSLPWDFIVSFCLFLLSYNTSALELTIGSSSCSSWMSASLKLSLKFYKDLNVCNMNKVEYRITSNSCMNPSISRPRYIPIYVSFKNSIFVILHVDSNSNALYSCSIFRIASIDGGFFIPTPIQNSCYYCC